MTEIILASQSPRRSQLLQQAHIPFEVIVQSIDETWPAGMLPEEVPQHIARNKALAVKAMLPADPRPIIAADTIVLLNGEVINKPQNREEAVIILQKLSGQTHRVITGVVILHGGKEITFSETTEVEFDTLTGEGIAFYVDEYKPYDKAGAYAIQEWIGVTGIRAIRGDFYNVMGLPVNRLYKTIQSL